MRGRRVSILLVDDNNDDLELTRRAVATGYPDAVFTTASTAIEFDTHVVRHFDCVITDYQLGCSDGLTLLKRLKAHHPDQPVIMFTNTGTEDICATGMRSGLSDYSVKRKEEFPKLPAAVRTALALAAAHEELLSQEARIGKLLESERAAKAKAERASELKDEFLAMLAHELRNPLAPISAAAELLSLAQFDPSALKRTSRLRADPETTAIHLVAISGYGQAQARANALHAGFDHHLVKPVNIAALTALLAEIMK